MDRERGVTPGRLAGVTVVVAVAWWVLSIGGILWADRRGWIEP